MAHEEIEAFVKFNTYYQEQTKRFQNDISRFENWTYDAERDEYICAWNQRLTFRYERTVKTVAGYSSKKRYYQCDACGSCPLRNQCTKSQNNRQIGVSVTLQAYKQRSRANLKSKRGRKLSVQRMVEVESVFGQIKGNRGFRRFLLRGIPKVAIEMGLVSVAHNLLKVAASLA